MEMEKENINVIVGEEPIEYEMFGDLVKIHEDGEDYVIRINKLPVNHSQTTKKLAQFKPGFVKVTIKQGNGIYSKANKSE